MDDMLTTAEVSAQFNISINTLQSPLQRKRMGLKGYLQKRKLYFRRSEVEEWEKHRYENDARIKANSKLPNIKWQILNKKKADEMKLELIDIDKNNSLLRISLCNIPDGWTLSKFLTFIIKEGIVFQQK